MRIYTLKQKRVLPVVKHDIPKTDALKPEILDGLITTAIKSNLDQKEYNRARIRQETERKRITALLPHI